MSASLRQYYAEISSPLCRRKGFFSTSLVFFIWSCKLNYATTLMRIIAYRNSPQLNCFRLMLKKSEGFWRLLEGKRSFFLTSLSSELSRKLKAREKLWSCKTTTESFAGKFARQQVRRQNERKLIWPNSSSDLKWKRLNSIWSCGGENKFKS